ncbi:aminotransferase class IV [Rhabdothermincola sediminis]|uniref:aminotransferase class IV n=1 Tax=Rhabdothermincola sediminis TaxID=2751370 RepID=UPI001AA029DB|nr:aminotransferase class IV [Rhabdothermincola sediminis]
MTPDSPLVWIDGALRAPDDASVSAWDHGLTVGDGVFETTKVLHGQAFALTRHFRRLRRSAAGLGLEIPYDDGELRAGVAATIAANHLTEGRARITVTGGAGPLGSNRGDGGPTILIAVSPQPPWPPSAAVVTVPWRRNEHSAVAGLKTTSYAENVVALRYANEHGGQEAIFANTAGNLCEGTGTNVFLGLDGRLWTPPLSAGCLAGITRELVLELVEVVEADIPLDRLAQADEAFLTSSTRDIQPIRSVDGVVLAACPGPLTEHAMRAFRELQARTLDP